MSIFGWFISPHQEKPEHDPGLDVPCPYCLKKLERHVMAISLWKTNAIKSYFYRAHKYCYEAATDDERNQVEWSLIDIQEKSNEQ